MTETVKH